jgi:hypothetical protein
MPKKERQTTEAIAGRKPRFAFSDCGNGSNKREERGFSAEIRSQRQITTE